MGLEGGMRYKINILPCVQKNPWIGKTSRTAWSPIEMGWLGQQQEKDNLQEVVSHI